MIRTITALVALVALASCGNGNAYTLYREGRFGGPGRVHIATFDASESDEYNWHNCEYVVERIMAEPGVTERHWCERGRFRS